MFWEVALITHTSTQKTPLSFSSGLDYFPIAIVSSWGGQLILAFLHTLPFELGGRTNPCFSIRVPFPQRTSTHVSKPFPSWSTDAFFNDFTISCDKSSHTPCHPCLSRCGSPAAILITVQLDWHRFEIKVISRYYSDLNEMISIRLFAGNAFPI